jgi:hypothetical protein
VAPFQRRTNGLNRSSCVLRSHPTAVISDSGQ